MSKETGLYLDAAILWQSCIRLSAAASQNLCIMQAIAEGNVKEAHAEDGPVS